MRANLHTGFFEADAFVLEEVPRVEARHNATIGELGMSARRVTSGRTARRAWMFAVASENRLQLVPNWKGMMMPDTTPIANETEKIFVRKLEIRR